MTNQISFETKQLLERWNNGYSESAREALLKNYLIKKYLNTEMRQFLEEFTCQFDKAERLKVLMLCRKLLVQNPERIMDFDAEFYRMRRDEIQLEINNDIALDGVSWIDEELRYLEAIKDLMPTASQIAPISASPTTVPAQSKSAENFMTKPNESPYMTKKEAMAFFRWSPTTFDRRVKIGFPYYKGGGKIGLIDRALAIEWFEKHEPRKIAFVRNGAKDKATKPAIV